MSDLGFEPVPVLACVPNHCTVLPSKQKQEKPRTCSRAFEKVIYQNI